eukprot:gene5652-biopygen13276
MLIPQRPKLRDNGGLGVTRCVWWGLRIKFYLIFLLISVSTAVRAIYDKETTKLQCCPLYVAGVAADVLLIIPSAIFY